MKIIIIGSVASGTSVATKARRNSERATITLYD
ncbi:MAG: FAD-dependent oxidoreductase, partial [Lactococcus raffinolactis]